jgi:hypothetical protein
LSNPFEKHHWDWANCETRCETSCAPVTLRVSLSAAIAQRTATHPAR